LNNLGERVTVPRVQSMTHAVSTFSLPRFVEDVYALKPSDGRARHERLPDGRTTLVFRELVGGRGDVCVAGPRTHALFKDTPGVVRAVILQLRPGWSLPLLGVPAHTVTDLIIPLEDIWGHPGRELCAQLLDAPTVSGVVDCIAEAVERRIQNNFEPSSARLARQATRLIEGGEMKVDAVAERLGVTARHLRRAFVESVGVGPKDFARSVRLRRALKLAGGAGASTNWGRIAVDAGYYDQAHLIADFRELVGITPGVYGRRRLAGALA
jgi:AraC-like DNA-binding protein